MVTTILIILSAIFSLFAFVGTIIALINIEAFKRSTHKVMMYDTRNQEFEPLTAETKKKLQEEPFDNVM